MLWTAIIISLLGKFCVIKNKLLWGCSLWAVSDTYLLFHNLFIKEYEQSLLFFIFLLFSIWGMLKGIDT